MKLLVKNADVLVTMDGDRRELKGGNLLIEDGVIASVGPEADEDKLVDA